MAAHCKDSGLSHYNLMFSFYGQSLLFPDDFGRHISIGPFPPPYMIGYYAGPFTLLKTTSCIATQVTDPTLDYCTILLI